MTASRTRSSMRPACAMLASLLLALLLGAPPTRSVAAQAQRAATEPQLATEQAQPGASQAPPSPARFSDLHCGAYTISVEMRVESWRYCDSYYYSLTGSGPVPWRTAEFSSPVSACEALTINGAPAVAVLLEDGTIPCFRCDGTPAAIYDLRPALQPQSPSMVTGTISAESPQLRLFGVGQDGGSWAVFGFDVELADNPPITALRVRWKRQFDGVDLPLDRESMRAIWMSGTDVAVASAVYDQNGDCLFGPSPWTSWATYKLDGETGALLEPVWVGALEIDPDVPAGTGVRGARPGRSCRLAD